MVDLDQEIDSPDLCVHMIADAGHRQAGQKGSSHSVFLDGGKAHHDLAVWW